MIASSPGKECSSGENGTTRNSLSGDLFETAAIFSLFLLFACSPTPGVNETHYLIKARHYWEPGWCGNDFFLQSADAHGVFYWSFGWLTRFLSLDATAWTGRFITWLLLAWSWQRLSWSVVPSRWISLLSAGLFLLLIKRFHMAGEWVVGGLEAKGIAYVFVFAGLSAIVRDRWRMAFSLFGAAAAFHVIVGGWAVLLAMFTWCILLLRGEARTDRAGWIELLSGLAIGGGLSLAGLLPCLFLNANVPDETVASGNQIYVYVRLQHHLVISSFHTLLLIRHAILMVATLAVLALVPRSAKLSRLFPVACGCVLLVLAGWVIDRSAPWLGPETAAGLLRYYWYRMSDALLPVVLSLAIVWFWSRWPGRNWQLLGGLAIVAAIGWNLGDVVWQRHQSQVPDSMNVWLRDKPQGPLSRRELYHCWLDCCRWARENTSPNDLFITTSTPASFVWHAGRAEVASWKNAPQDARGLVEWIARMENIRNRQWLQPPEIDSTLPIHERWRQVAMKHGAKYVVIDRRKEPLPGWIRVYPTATEPNPVFAVYRVGE